MLLNHLTPATWLTRRPLQAGERLYLIISNASDAAPLQAFYQQESAALTPIWQGTPYANWHAVMPYLAELRSDSPYLTWIAETDARDWGWLAISRCTQTTVFEHLRSLTQVRMPDVTEVFFRFWDGRHLYPMLQALGAEAGELLPVFHRYLINGQALEFDERPVSAARAWPWWEVPPSLLSQMANNDPSPIIDNLLQWLKEDYAELYFSFPEPNLRQKVARFVARTSLTEDHYSGLLKAHLEHEVNA